MVVMFSLQRSPVHTYVVVRPTEHGIRELHSRFSPYLLLNAHHTNIMHARRRVMRPRRASTPLQKSLIYPTDLPRLICFLLANN